MKTNLVSIIIPLYNAEQYIEKCINSIVNQTFKKFEIIIINDGSTDGSLKICENLKYKYSKIRFNIISQCNSGPSKARNNGLKNAKGNYIMFVDADDFLAPKAIEIMIENDEKNTLIRSNYKVYNGKRILNNEINIGNVNASQYIYDVILGKSIGSVWGCLFKKNLIDDIFFDESIHFMEDTLFLIKYVSTQEKVKFVNADYFYRMNDNSITRSNDKILSNIESFCNSLTRINSLLNNNFYRQIDVKKVVLIEKEVSKISDYKEINNIILNEDFQLIINSINLSYVDSKFYRIILLLYKRKKIFLIFIYNSIRKKIKQIKDRR